jgi:hypothetical protein
MKRAILLGVIFILSLNMKAQITLENTYVNIQNDFELIDIGNNEIKYYYFDNINGIISLYNLDHSVYKSITIPAQATGFGCWYVSNSLFNTDNKLEYLIYNNLPGPNYNGTKFVKIYNEDNLLLFSLDSAGIQNTGNRLEGNIVNTTSGTKMILTSYKTNDLGIKIFSLPGSLSCSICGGYAGISESNSNESRSVISNPFPNPTNDKTTINYELPEGVNQGKLVFYDAIGNIVKEFNVDNSFKDLQVSSSDLSAGTYYFQLQTSKGISGGKKLFVIK